MDVSPEELPEFDGLGSGEVSVFEFLSDRRSLLLGFKFLRRSQAIVLKEKTNEAMTILIRFTFRTPFEIKSNQTVTLPEDDGRQSKEPE